MLYLNISDESVEVITSETGILGSEEITGCGRKLLPPNLIKSGLIADPQGLKAVFGEINLAKPGKKSTENPVSIAVSDDNTVIRRFEIISDKDSAVPDMILEIAAKELKGDPVIYENFYRVIKTEENRHQVLYAAVPISTISSYHKFLTGLGLKLNFLTVSSFALANLLTPQIEDDQGLLFCQTGDKSTRYYLFDKNGPLDVLSTDKHTDITRAQLSQVISKLESKHKTGVKKIVLPAKNYQDMDFEEIKTLRLDEILETAVKSRKLEFDSGNVSRVLFAPVIALIISSKGNLTPNFAADIGKISEPEFKSGEVTAVKEGRPDTGIASQNLSGLDEEVLVEYKKTNLFSSPKVKLIFIAIIIAVVLAVGALAVSSQKLALPLPFISQPTLTPTSTPTPSVTPTPTIDPSLKRSDLKVAVQNGTQTGGLAKTTAEDLEKLGYKNIDKGNADRDDYEKTVIKIKDDKKNYLGLVQADLKEKYEITTVETLDSDSKFDLIIILGKK